MQQPSTPIDSRRFRHVMGSFATGVTVITALGAEGQVIGLTANAFSALSIEPPLVLVCLDYGSGSYRQIQQHGAFAVNILSDQQADVALDFARRGPDKGAATKYRISDRSLPILEESLAWIECALDREYEGGDHAILIGRVLELHAIDEGSHPLLYYRGRMATAAAMSVAMQQASAAAGGGQ
jgi:flavin reductase (DIM6/NTAB) family NADH-FMN oxidoreductase RutF